MSDAETFERCMGVGGVAVFPADTVYGLACDVHNRIAVERLYRLKRRRRDKPSAVMFFDRSIALDALPELGARTRAALERLLPGPVTALLTNPERRFPLACGDDPSTFGLRVPVAPALAGVRRPVLQSSANLAGGSDARRLAEVPEILRRMADLIIDAGELPGTPSTVVDLRRYEDEDAWSIVRAGGLPEADVAAALPGRYHFDPATYDEMLLQDIPGYDELQSQLAAASGEDARRVLELGTGTGETTRRLLARHPDATLVGLDESAPMLDAARAALPADRVSLVLRAIEDPLPPGPFDLVASALCVHHVAGEGKRDVFTRVRAALAPGGRFVLGDVVVPADPADAVTALTPGFDHPSSVSDQMTWLADAGFTPRVVWEHRDLAVLVADAPG
ncbi:MAG TPA: Sua5/YciO/YrdC/YwlC family protein [Solirubrobacteraceae bacterium]|jgi:tRNA threonylcarbamoyl adenosine modification protein (Sua5/YciO/YrdC/YwlC family)|nr:Sua5/YciO/YrdC/YwlC family protein [Solirubrobacteraceae bacterium]